MSGTPPIESSGAAVSGQAGLLLKGIQQGNILVAIRDDTLELSKEMSEHEAASLKDRKVHKITTRKEAVQETVEILGKVERGETLTQEEARILYSSLFVSNEDNSIFTFNNILAQQLMDDLANYNSVILQNIDNGDVIDLSKRRIVRLDPGDFIAHSMIYDQSQEQLEESTSQKYALSDHKYSVLNKVISFEVEIETKENDQNSERPQTPPTGPSKEKISVYASEIRYQEDANRLNYNKKQLETTEERLSREVRDREILKEKE